MANVNQIIKDTFNEIAEGLTTGSFGKRPKIEI